MYEVLFFFYPLLKKEPRYMLTTPTHWGRLSSPPTVGAMLPSLLIFTSTFAPIMAPTYSLIPRGLFSPLFACLQR